MLENRVKQIIDDVVMRQDAALIDYTEKFDHVTLGKQDLRITSEEIEESYRRVSEDQISAIESMKRRVETLEKQTLNCAETEIETDGFRVRTLSRPIESVGCYVPGGEASYPSTLVMAATPAKLAKVSRVVICSPPTEQGTINSLTLVAADICEVDEIYKVGGVQAIAALAYGTESIKPVRKIVGPGNKYVTMAKALVSRDIAIDMPAGPSEVLILADETADPRFVALDMVSQAEHSADSIAGLITTSEELAKKVINELQGIVPSARRGAIITRALSNQGFMVICRSTEEMVDLANDFSPEHIEILTREPKQVANKISTAGLILTGPYSPVSASDYCFGTNHILPTGGFGRTYSGLSVLDFVRRVGVVECSRNGLAKLRNNAKILAEAENLPNHFAAIEGRFEYED